LRSIRPKQKREKKKGKKNKTNNNNNNKQQQRTATTTTNKQRNESPACIPSAWSMVPRDIREEPTAPVAAGKNGSKTNTRKETTDKQQTNNSQTNAQTQIQIQTIREKDNRAVTSPHNLPS
jgi:hypothetical protein